MELIAQRWLERELRAGSNWLGFAVAATPVFDRLDDAGLVGMLARGSFELGQGGIAALLWSALFIALGVAVAQIQRRHRPAARWWFLAGCAAPLFAYALADGFRASAAISGLALGVAALRLRAARGHDTLQRDVESGRARYAGGPGDVLPPS